MLFNSIPYLLLLSFAFVFVRVFSNRKTLLLFFSLIFFCYAGFLDASIFIATVFINWLILQKSKTRKIGLQLSIFFNSSLLIFLNIKVSFY